MLNKVLGVTLGALVSFAVVAAAVDIDGVDTLLMQDMDAYAKDLEPLIGARNGPAAADAAKFLSKGLKWTEDYFANQHANDAVQFARDGQQQAAAVVTALSRGDFTAAASAARALTKSCRACHDVYRP